MRSSSIHQMASTSVLLVEDNPADSDRIEFFLRAVQEGSFRLTAVESLREGLEQLDQQGFDAVLLDLTLPDASNLDAVRRMTQAWPALPIIVLTGLADAEAAISSLQHGVQDYLSKDRIDSDALARSLRYAIERKRITEEARRAHEALRRAERLASLGKLAAGIAHEINNPILAAWASAQAALNVKDDPQSRDLLDDCLQNIVRSVQRCRDTVGNILQFARHGEVERQACQLDEVVPLAVQEVHHYAETQQTSIEWDCQGELPEIMANAIQLQQVVVALLRNAIEASSKGDSIKIRCDRNCRGVRMIISDSGCGMTPDEKQHAFDPFFTSRKESGTGLGLSIVHGIVEGHGGEIEMESQEGEGTVMTVVLPVPDEVPLDETK